MAEYRIPGTNEVVKVGDCVLLQIPHDRDLPYVGEVVGFDPPSTRDRRVHLKWYYIPDETREKKQSFHGRKEVFLSDDHGKQSVHSIEGKCTVHSLSAYEKLKKDDALGPEDYFCRYYYNHETGAFDPNYVEVFCICEMPNNPDSEMVECSNCGHWYHLSCMGLTLEQVQADDYKYDCIECLASRAAHVKGGLSGRRDEICARLGAPDLGLGGVFL